MGLLFLKGAKASHYLHLVCIRTVQVVKDTNTTWASNNIQKLPVHAHAHVTSGGFST